MEKGIVCLQIFVDLQIIIKCINDENQIHNWVLGSLLEKTNGLKAEVKEVSITHIYTEKKR